MLYLLHDLNIHVELNKQIASERRMRWSEAAGERASTLRGMLRQNSMDGESFVKRSDDESSKIKKGTNTRILISLKHGLKS
jgi:hypothetical protein